MRGRVVEGERDEGVQKKNEWERKDCREREKGEGKRGGKREGEPHTDCKYITETQRRNSLCT